MNRPFFPRPANPAESERLPLCATVFSYFEGLLCWSEESAPSPAAASALSRAWARFLGPRLSTTHWHLYTHLTFKRFTYWLNLMPLVSRWCYWNYVRHFFCHDQTFADTLRVQLPLHRFSDVYVILLPPGQTLDQTWFALCSQLPAGARLVWVQMVCPAAATLNPPAVWGALNRYWSRLILRGNGLVYEHVVLLFDGATWADSSDASIVPPTVIPALPLPPPGPPPLPDHSRSSAVCRSSTQSSPSASSCSSCQEPQDSPTPRRLSTSTLWSARTLSSVGPSTAASLCLPSSVDKSTTHSLWLSPRFSSVNRPQYDEYGGP